MNSTGRNIDMEKLTIKIVVLGTSNVGKSALITRYCTDKFSGVRRATVGADFMTKKIQIMDFDVVLQIWDTAGQERFHQNTIGAAFYRGADGCLLVYDVTNEKSIEQLCQWRDELLERVSDDNYYFPIVVVGNKMDLLDEENHPSPSSSPPLDNENIDEDSHNNNNNDKNETWKTSPATATDLEQATVTAFMAREEVKKWCRENEYGHVETSAKDGDGVSAAITAITALVIEQLRESGLLASRIAAEKEKRNNRSKHGHSGNKIDVIGEKYSHNSRGNCC